jgi:hypothetical protein
MKKPVLFLGTPRNLVSDLIAAIVVILMEVKDGVLIATNTIQRRKGQMCSMS